MAVKFFKCEVCGIMTMTDKEEVPYGWVSLEEGGTDGFKALCPVCAGAIFDEIDALRDYREACKARFRDAGWE